jgi:uncharacterized membrane protein HdeD (DUF308 family)
MDTAVDDLNEELEEAAEVATSLWWLMLLIGLGWFLVALVILRFDTTSLATVGVLLGFVFLGAGANELMEAWVLPGWRWAHALLGLFFVAGAIWAFVTPGEAFWALASILGLLLVLKGTMDIVLAVSFKPVNPVWGLGLAAGILEVLLGFWASQQYFPARAALILIWAAFMAMFRGAFNIALGLQLHHARKRLAV